MKATFCTVFLVAAAFTVVSAQATEAEPATPLATPVAATSPAVPGFADAWTLRSALPEDSLFDDEDRAADAPVIVPDGQRTARWVDPGLSERR
jgi:hypothetical protein